MRGGRELDTIKPVGYQNNDEHSSRVAGRTEAAPGGWATYQPTNRPKNTPGQLAEQASASHNVLIYSTDDIVVSLLTC